MTRTRALPEFTLQGDTATCQEGMHELSLTDRESAQGEHSLSEERALEIPLQLLSNPTSPAVLFPDPAWVYRAVFLGSFIDCGEKWELPDVVHMPFKCLSTFFSYHTQEDPDSPHLTVMGCWLQCQHVPQPAEIK